MVGIDSDFTPESIKSYASQFSKFSRTEHLFTWTILGRMMAILYLNLPEEFNDNLEKRLQEMNTQFIEDPEEYIYEKDTMFEQMYGIGRTLDLLSIQDLGTIPRVYGNLSRYYHFFHNPKMPAVNLMRYVTTIVGHVHELLDLLYNTETFTHGIPMYEVPDCKFYIWDRMVRFLNAIPEQVSSIDLGDKSQRKALLDQMTSDILNIDEIIVDFF